MSKGVNRSKLHECEFVYLHLDEPLTVGAIRRVLYELGLNVQDDYFHLERHDPVMPWQSQWIATVDLFRDGGELNVYIDDEDGAHGVYCDSLRFSYLFAALPFACAAEFLTLIAGAMRKLDAAIEHRDQDMNGAGLKAVFERYRKDIHDELAEEPGSEGLAKVIKELGGTQ